MDDKYTESLLRLVKGQVPTDDEILKYITVGTDIFSSFYRKYYFQDYIANGGSAVRFITGKKGSGKSHALALLEMEARNSNFMTISLDAYNFILNDITELYKSVFKSVDFELLTSLVCKNLLTKLGYTNIDYSLNISALDQLSNSGELDAITRNEIKTKIRELTLNNPYIDNNFAIILSSLISDKIGLYKIDPQERECFMRYLEADKTLKITEIKQVDLLPYKINKYNARLMLRSFSELCNEAGFAGLYISVDNLDVLLNVSPVSSFHYTKTKRDDTYEGIRQIIDDTDYFRNFFIVFSMNTELIINDKIGLKSYQALWLRIQNEIVSSRFNPFSALIDMDNMNKEYLSDNMLMDMSKKICSQLQGLNVETSPINEEQALEIIKTAKYSGNSLPYLVNHATVRFKAEQNNEGEI